MNSEVRINLNNMINNVDYLKSIMSNSEIYPVIKSNAYGHGTLKIAQKLSENEIKTVCVATCNEIVEIINSNIKLNIFHLGKIFLKKNIMKKNVVFTINSIDDIKYINSVCKKNNYVLRCHIKVDTGMRRLGCEMIDFCDIYKLALKSKSIKLEGVYSHLSSADNKNSKHNSKQINNFKKIVNQVKESNIKFHLLNSAGVFNYKNYLYDFVRPGLSIYGISPNKKINDNLKPVMEFIAPIILRKQIKRGDKIGYGCSFIAKKNMKMAVVQCGYGDGVPIEFSNIGQVFYKEFQFPIIGRVSMDLICIDITKYNQKKNIEKVTIWGGNNKYSRLEYIANKFNTIPYEYLTRISNRVERKYV